MSLGRKIANRIQLAYLIPLGITIIIGTVVAAFYQPLRDPLHYLVGQILVLIPAVAIGRLLTHRIADRLALLRHSAERIEQGDFSTRLIPGRQSDEFADLARAFNHMSDVLAARESALREQNQILAGLNHRLESVLNATYDGIALLDRDGCFALVNRRFCEMLGTRADLLLKQALTEIGPILNDGKAPADELTHRLAALGLGDAHSLQVSEQIIEFTTPEHRFLQVYTAPVLGEDGSEQIGRILALRDVTREKELDKLKTDFISVVSHELRTPLTSIKGYTDLLLSGAAGETTDLQCEFLGIIQGSTTRLSNLINDILDISRIESGGIKVKYEPIDYRLIVSDVLRLMKAAADEKQITMDASLPQSMPLVRGDTDKVTQILTNLVSNAIKYTPEGGWIKVLLEVSGDASVTTCVADSGIGIAEADQKKLFQKFFRADNSSTREAGGTGLGLVIAKTLVELLGGAIWVDSEAGRGSRFFFTLPLFLETGQARHPLNIALPDRGIALVMVIDDDHYVRGLLLHHLHRRGYGTLEAESALDGLQKARQHKPDAIVVNMMMESMDGLTALRGLAQDPATAVIPCITVSLTGDPARGVVNVGTFGFLKHPANLERLRAAIQAALLGMDTRNLPTKTIVLIISSRSTQELMGSNKEFENAVSNLASENIHLVLQESPEEAVTFTITQSPSVIIIDTALPSAHLLELITALKAEEEAARIPIILITEEIQGDPITFYRGAESTDEAFALDYLSEQISRALSPQEFTAK